MRSRKLAIVGARGIGHHGGFESIVSELAPRLSDRGYEVYCSHRRTGSQESCGDYRGVKLMYFPFKFPERYSIGKIFELLYDWYYAIRCAFFMKCGIVYFLGVGVGIALPIARLSGSSLTVNVDGLEWKRAKFGPLARAYLKLSFYASCAGAGRLVLDNAQLLDHVPRRFRHKAVCIVNGVTVEKCSEWNQHRLKDYLGDRFSLVTPGGYWLVVARLEPENNIHTILESYSVSGSCKPLVLVGNFSSISYKNLVEGLIRNLPSGKTVIEAGSIYDKDCLHMLRCHCFAYVHGHSVGGTNPSLLEAMSVGNIVVAHDNSFNKDVCGSLAKYFKDTTTLAECFDAVENNPGDFARNGALLRSRAEERYNWDVVVAAYDNLFSEGISSNH